MSKYALCFSANRICHHDDYYAVISKFTPTVNVKSFSAKVKGLLSNRLIFFLDIDSHDLVFVPLILIRSLWGGKGCGISVRTEYLIDDVSFKHFLLHPTTSKYFHIRLKRLFFYIIRRCSKTKIISIHKRHELNFRMTPYVDEFIYDPQLWDLPLLLPNAIKPDELSDDFFEQDRTIILIAGRLNEQRSRLELLEFLSDIENRRNERIHYLFAGNMDSEDALLLSSLNYCTVINRFTSNEELHYVMTHSDVIYCYYQNGRPSGFYGRATQLQKPILVRANGYLHEVYYDYPFQIPVSSLDQLNTALLRNLINKGNFNDYDDSNRFHEIVSSLQPESSR